MAFVLFHELVHGLRGEEGKKDRLEEELFAGTVENEIRRELGYSLRDLSNLEKVYKDYNNVYRDDWNRIAFEYSEAYFGTVKLQDPTSSLNVRSGALITSEVIGSLQHGSIIQIIGTEGQWYKISFNGKVGYVRGDYVRLGAVSGGTGNTGTIQLQDSSSSLNVRSSASINSSVIGSLPYGSVVEIIGTEGQWYKIKFNGKVGYVRSDYVVRGGSLSIGSDKYESSFKDGYIRYYAQDDPRYGNIMYSNHGDRGQTIANSACGATAFSIVVSTLNNIDVPPTEICRYALSHGYRTYNSGTSANLFSGASYDSSNPRYNLNYQSVGSISGVKSILSDNKHLVIASMGSGHVTRQGHYIVLAGYTTINGKVYFKVYDPHRWNEYYIYDGEIIDTVKDDGFILLSQNAIVNEAQGYYAFSSKKGSSLKPSSGSSSSTSGSHSSSTSSSSSSSSSSSNKEKVNVITVTGNFLEGVADAGRESVKGVWDFLAHPIKGLTSTSECIVFVGKAIVPGTDANKVFAKMAEKFVSDVSQGNANENAKRIGRIVGEIAICVIVDHGVGMLTDIISGSGKLEELSMLVGKAQKGEVTREEVASRLIEGSGKYTGTIWDSIAGTAKNMPGTEIPATFRIKVGEGISYINPTTGSNVLWTNANGTEHMGEYISRFGKESWTIGMRSQAMLESYSAALNKAMREIAQKTPGRYFGTYGNWELGINTETGVVYHAIMR